jgi:hypothetical protein
MKTFRIILLVTGILIAGCAIRVHAQVRPQKTSSAKAYYGQPQGKPKVDLNKKKKGRGHTRATPGAKAIRANSRKRYSQG